jgi:hypothetical protein
MQTITAETLGSKECARWVPKQVETKQNTQKDVNK